MGNPITNKVKKGKIPVIKKELDDGVVAEANNDGTIFLDKDIKNNSPQAKEAVEHEMVHMDQMARGDLNYDDNNVYWKGKKYPRDKMNEGSDQLPWESEAYNKTNNMKKSSPNKIKLGLSRDVLGQRAGMMEDQLRMKADKHATIGRAVAELVERHDPTGKFAKKIQEKNAEKANAAGQMNLKNKNKSPLKASPITFVAGSGSKFEYSIDEGSTEKVKNPKTPESSGTQPSPKEDSGSTKGGGSQSDEKHEVNEDGNVQPKAVPKQRVAMTSYEEGYKKGQGTSPMKRKSPVKSATDEAKDDAGDSSNTRVSTEVIENANVDDQSGTITSKKTETDTKERTEASKKFEENCYNRDESGKITGRKKEGEKVNGMTCSWTPDEDYDPESEYETTTHVSYDDTFEPDKEKEVEPGTPDKHNMGYYESMDAKWGAGVRHRGNKKVHRISKRAGDKWDRKGGEIIDPTTGKNYASKEDYIKAMSSAATGIYDIPVGKTQKGTKGSETEVDAGAKDENKNYKKIDGRFVEVDAEGKPIEKKKEEKKEENTDDSAVDYNKKNKGKSPFKQNGDKQLKDAKAEKIPTRNDSVISASHHKHITNKNPLYKDSFYDSHRKKAAKIAKKFPALDKYMQTEKGRASVGQGSPMKKKPSAFKQKGWKAYKN